MDNNQQDMTPVQPAVSDKITPANQVGPINSDTYDLNTRPLWDRGYDITNLGIHEPTTMAGAAVANPLTGANVSMTTGQPYGGPIVTTEIEPNVRREAGPY
jgi:hypothetical protein